MRFKNLEGKLERKSLKRTISTSGGLGLLQNVRLDMINDEQTGPVCCEIRAVNQHDIEEKREFNPKRRKREVVF